MHPDYILHHPKFGYHDLINSLQFQLDHEMPLHGWATNQRHHAHSPDGPSNILTNKLTCNQYIDIIKTSDIIIIIIIMNIQMFYG